MPKESFSLQRQNVPVHNRPRLSTAILRCSAKAEDGGHTWLPSSFHCCPQMQVADLGCRHRSVSYARPSPISEGPMRLMFLPQLVHPSVSACQVPPFMLRAASGPPKFQRQDLQLHQPTNTRPIPLLR
eukprot:EG_transcript_32388